MEPALIASGPVDPGSILGRVTPKIVNEEVEASSLGVQNSRRVHNSFGDTAPDKISGGNPSYSKEVHYIPTLRTPSSSHN